MSTQELAPKKPQIGKWMLIAAIATLFVGILFLLFGFVGYGAVILSSLLLCAAAILYLTRKEQAAVARVCGICGVLPLALLPLFVVGTIHPFVFPFTMAIGGLIMAIGGIVLALKRPKRAGILMLAAAIGSMAALLVSAATPVDDVGAGFLMMMLALCLLSISFLIPGGILALTSQKGQPASKKMVVVAIAAFFLAPALFYALLPALVGLRPPPLF